MVNLTINYVDLILAITIERGATTVSNVIYIWQYIKTCINIVVELSTDYIQVEFEVICTTINQHIININIVLKI